MKRTLFTVLALFAALTMVLASIMPVSAGAGGNDKKLFEQDGIYIVQMSDAPVVAYTGGISGYAATYRGRKIDPNDSKVIDYVGYLVDKHDKALGDAGGGKKLYDYVYTFNGFAAELTAAQANKISTLADVLSVSADETRNVDTFSTPTFLGLDAANGLWEQLGGVDNAGADIIIGIIDTGIWPESISFSDRTGENGNDTRSGKLDYQQIPGWHGKCVPGEAFNASMCNQKLIGAQWFNAAWGGDEGIDADLPWEFVSPRDYNGHGTHTSSTAGGNNVDLPAKYGVYSTVSGMAPHARIAMYKALWTLSDGTGSGYTSDLVAAIDTAVADGVDVISYSISGSRTNFRDPVEISFMYAANAGIFVAASAGNNGPASSTVAHPSPWITTVAAGTHGRTVNGSVTLGSDTYFGASIAGKTVTALVINSTAAGMPGAAAAAVAKCYSSAWNGGIPALDPVKVAGKIVVCDRGTSDRVDKSLAVLQAGGVGMILVNPTANNLVADPHSVPTVHLQNTYYTAVHAFASNAGAMATINMAAVDYSTPAPETADFSSRGPLLASGDLLKPDLIAPGVDILAAVAPPGNGGLDFNLYSGTSMSTPHVAGIAALFKQLHPDWTPMMIKSALMTTAYDVLDAPGSMPVRVQPGRRACPAQHCNGSRTGLQFQHARLARFPVRHATTRELLHLARHPGDRPQ